MAKRAMWADDPCGLTAEDYWRETSILLSEIAARDSRIAELTARVAELESQSG